MSKPLISVIIPIYNVEEYLKDTIESVINQSIGFNNIELILVNDGSTDNSGSICEYYTNKYPENVIYKKLKNGGVSRARNVGIDLSRGEYIHFLDGDDMLSTNFYSESINFLKINKNIDFVASKLMFFDAIIDSHPLNYKFAQDRIIDIEKYPNNPILHAVSCVFRKKAATQHKFNEDLSFAEDVVYVSDILRKRGSYGVLRKPTYYYRKRQNNSSAIGGKLSSHSYYVNTPRHAYGHLLETWNNDGAVGKYMQHTLLYDLSYRFRQDSQMVLDSLEEADYKNLILSIAVNCEDDVILARDDYTIHMKAYILRRKYGKGFINRLKITDNGYFFNNIKLSNDWCPKVHLDFISIDGSTVNVEGYLDEIIDVSDVIIDVSGDKYKLTSIPRKQREVSFLRDEIFNGGAFKVSLSIKAGDSISFRLTSQHTDIPIKTGVFTKLSSFKGAYFVDGDLIVFKKRDTLRLVKKSKILLTIFELRFLLSILFNWRFDLAKDQYAKLRNRNIKQLSIKSKVIEIFKPLLIIIETIVYIPRAFLLRTLYHFCVNFSNKPIWLISDRGMAAGDNGEALFEYINKKESAPANVYFVISKKSKDYKRISKIGKVVNQDSLIYKLKFLMSDMVISSHADIEVTNPFIRQVEHYQDLFSFKFIFLQHGVTKNDISGWLNKYEKNIELFITVSNRERDLILSNPFYYDDKKVVLTGFPRYDRLSSDPKNKLILAPTYRKDLAIMKTNRRGVRGYNPKFVNSEYFKFYNRFINDKRILDAFLKHNITGEFYLHPALESQRKDFKDSSVFKVMNYPYDYQKAFREGSLMITDNSSVVFDFAYLKKPVIYTHFDIGYLYNEHGFGADKSLSDEDDGFGPVTYTYEDLVTECLRFIDRGFVMDDKYIDRVDNFFLMNDKNNSRRVYEKMIGLLKKTQP